MRCIMKEEWKDIPGYEGFYQASTKGRVRSLNRICTVYRGSTKYKRKLKGKIRSLVNLNGYNGVRLSKDGDKKLIQVGRLIALTFIPNPNNKPQINHKNGIKTDDRVENIEWCTQSENTQHAYDNGLIKKRLGENHHNSILTKVEVANIRDEYETGEVSQQYLANKYSVARKTIGHIVNFNTWTHI